MHWYEAFKKFKDLVKINVQINLSQLIHFEINVINNPTIQEPIIVDKKAKKITANFAKLTKKQKQVVQKTIKSAVEEHDYLLIENSTESAIEDIKKSEALPEIKESIEVLKDVLSPIDLQIFKSALYLRTKYEMGEKELVRKLKTEIAQRHGERGRNITNLCTAGYFDNVVIPFLKETKKDPSYSKEAIMSSCNLFIEEAAFAVFVPSATGETELMKMISDRINTNSKYGLKFIKIHGIGKTIIKRIRIVVEKIISASPNITKAEEIVIGNAISIRLNIN